MMTPSRYGFSVDAASAPKATHRCTHARGGARFTLAGAALAIALVAVCVAVPGARCAKSRAALIVRCVEADGVDEFGVPKQTRKSALMNAFLCGAEEPSDPSEVP